MNQLPKIKITAKKHDRSELKLKKLKQQKKTKGDITSPNENSNIF